MGKDPLGLVENGAPCWILLDCSPFVYSHCPAYHHPENPCWENAYMQSEIMTGIKKGCDRCKVFRGLRHLPANCFSSQTSRGDSGEPSE